MDSIENISIHLSSDRLVLVNLALGVMMFGVSLSISKRDFNILRSNPKPFLIGVISQLVLLPLLTYFLVCVWQPHPGMALGMLLVAACPGGNVSNFLVHLFSGNRVLSVSLTSLSTLVSFVYTPASFYFWAHLYQPTRVLIRQFEISFFDLLQILTGLVIIPLVAGLLISKWFPILTQKIQSPIRIFSIGLFITLILSALMANRDNLVNYIQLVFLIVLMHNLLAIITGYSAALLAGLPTIDVRTIAMETGIQNSGLALIIILNFYGGMSSMMLIAGWWAIWHLISGFALALLWSTQKRV